MTNEGFWSRKIQKAGPVVQAAPRMDRPWWQHNSLPKTDNPVSISGDPRKATIDGTEIQVDLDERGEYKPKKASHLRNSGDCPECYSGNFGRGSNPSDAMRCFDCGYMQGRNISDANRPIGISSNAPPQQSRQITRMNVLDSTGKPLGTTTAASGMQPNYYGPSEGTQMSGEKILTHINGV